MQGRCGWIFAYLCHLYGPRDEWPLLIEGLSLRVHPQQGAGDVEEDHGDAEDEILIASLMLYRDTGEEKYLDWFEKTLD